MLSFFREYLATLGGIGAALAGLYFLVKLLVSHFLDKEKERYRGELERIAFTFRTQFSALHEKRASLIAELYRMLVERESLIGGQAILYSLTKGTDDVQMHADRKELATKALHSTAAISDFIKTNKIYFSESLAETLEALQIATTQAILLHNADFETYDVQNVDQRIDASAGNYHKALSAIEKEFRNLLGVTSTHF